MLDTITHVCYIFHLWLYNLFYGPDTGLGIFLWIASSKSIFVFQPALAVIVNIK